jgi:hypothetical protein
LFLFPGNPPFPWGPPCCGYAVAFGGPSVPEGPSPFAVFSFPGGEPFPMGRSTLVVITVLGRLPCPACPPFPWRFTYGKIPCPACPPFLWGCTYAGGAPFPCRLVYAGVPPFPWKCTCPGGPSFGENPPRGKYRGQWGVTGAAIRLMVFGGPVGPWLFRGGVAPMLEYPVSVLPGVVGGLVDTK